MNPQKFTHENEPFYDEPYNPYDDLEDDDEEEDILDEYRGEQEPEPELAPGIEFFFDPTLFLEVGGLHRIKDHNIKIKLEGNIPVQELPNRLYEHLMKQFPNLKTVSINLNGKDLEYDVTTFMKIEDTEFHLKAYDFTFIDKVLEQDYQQLGFHVARCNYTKLDAYGQQLQYLLDNFIRSETDDIALYYMDDLITHMENKVNDNTFYVMNFTNDTNQARSEYTSSFSYQMRENFMNLIRRSFDREDAAHVGSAQLSKISTEHTIDISITSQRYHATDRKNNVAGFFSYYYTVNNTKLNDILGKMQIFTADQINSRSPKNLYTQCILNSFLFFKNYLPDLAEQIVSLHRYFNKSFESKKIFSKIATSLGTNILLFEIGDDHKINVSNYLSDGTKEKVLVKTALEDHNVLKIGFFKNHAFPIFRCDLSPLFPSVLHQRLDYVPGRENRIRAIESNRVRYYVHTPTPAWNIQILISMDKSNYFIPLEGLKLGGLIRDKKTIAMAHEASSPDNTMIFPEDIKLSLPVIPPHRIVKLEDVDKEIFTKFVDEVFPEDIPDEKKKFYLEQILKLMKVPRDWEDVAEYIVYADTETTVLPSQKIVPYSIDYVVFESKVLKEFVEKGIVPKFSVTSLWGLQSYTRIPPGAEIKKNGNIDVLTYGEDTYRGLHDQINNLFYIENSFCIENFLNKMNKLTRIGERIDLYFHNAKFDAAMFSDVKHLKHTNLGTVMKDGKVFSQGLNYKGTIIKIIDSYKMLSFPLKDFPKSFNLPDTKKEYMPYSIYTPDVIQNPIRTPKEIRILFNRKKINGKCATDFIKHIKEVVPEAIENGNINLKTYSQMYSKLDVHILATGHIMWASIVNGFKFTPTVLSCREGIVKIINKVRENDPPKKDEQNKILKFCRALDKNNGLFQERGHCLYTYLTSASFADSFFMFEGCYEGVKTLGGSLLEYIMKSVIGGHTMTSLNQVHKGKVENLPSVPSKEYIEDVKILPKDKFYIKHHKDYLSDYDGVSLYPSAELEMPGFIKGYAKIMSQDQIDQLGEVFTFSDLCSTVNSFIPYSKMNELYNNFKGDKKDFAPPDIHFFVTCKFKDAGTESLFSMHRVNIKEIHPNTKYENQQWMNKVSKEECVLDKFTLEALMTTHQLEIGTHFDITYGCYFPDGYNPRIKNAIMKLKTMRDEFKKNGDPKEKVAKLIMNSGYGKTLVKPSSEKIKFFNGTEDEMYKKVLDRTNAPIIKIINKNIDGTNKNQYMIVEPDDHFNHQNRAHVGSSILGMSKIIMTRPKLIADYLWRYVRKVPRKSGDELGAAVYKHLDTYFKTRPMKHHDHYVVKYCDTDSLMGSYESFYIIKTIYEEIYGKSLDGNDFGQFHIDFVMKNKNLINIFGVRYIFLNKKEYAILLQGYNPVTQEFEYEVKFAYKGVPSVKIEQFAAKTFPDSKFPVMDLFESNRKYKIPIVEDGDFRVKYSNKGTTALAVTRLDKDLNLIQYANTYDRFISR